MENKVKLRNLDVENKRIVLRVDYNVTFVDGKIVDDNKIIQSLETINYLLSKNCSIVILSHLGKIKNEDDKLNNSLEIVAKRLNELVSANVIFSKQTRSSALEIKVKNLKPKEIIVLENTRFEDYPEKLESSNNLQLASYWAGLGDIFVMDAFASLHRKHASVDGIAHFLPSCIGFLVEKELKMLNNYVLNANKPFTIIVGGSKIDDKLELMKKLISKCDHMILGGGLANSCLKSLGLNVGTSLATDNVNVLNDVKNFLTLNKSKIFLPIDVIVSDSFYKENVLIKNVNEIMFDEMICDFGIKSLTNIKKIIDESNTIFVNGTLGIYEDVKFANGTKELFDILKNCGKTVIAGGGDCVGAVRKFGYENDFTYLLTGGGASLEYILNENLVGLENIDNEKNL